MPALNIYKGLITDLNEPFESDLGTRTMGERGDLAREEERREGEGGFKRKAAVMWRVNASAVGEQRRPRKKEAKEKKRRSLVEM